MEKTECALNLPYPNVQGQIDYQTMAMLMQAYGGRLGETTAIMQYQYQRFGLKNEQLKKVLLEISIAEMEHFELLGEAIKTFGGKPTVSGAFSFWNGSFVNYTTDEKLFLQNNIESEQKAINHYEQTIRLTDNISLQKLLGRIIMDEQLHISIFNQFLSQLN